MLSTPQWYKGSIAFALVALTAVGLFWPMVNTPQAAAQVEQPTATFTPTVTFTPTQTPPPPIPPGALVGTVIRANVLIVRSAPFLGAGEVGRVRRGENYAIVGRNPQTDWYLIQLYGTQGWVWNYYMAVDGNAFSAAASSPYITAGDPSNNAEVVVQSTSALKLRAEADVNSPQIGRIPWGDYLPVIGRSTRGSWYQVVYKDTVGWVFAPYTKVVQGDPDTVQFVGAPDTQPAANPNYNITLDGVPVIIPDGATPEGNFAVITSPAGNPLTPTPTLAGNFAIVTTPSG
jgi:uncharacterized protein YgiM (DUF1202 family)